MTEAAFTDPGAPYPAYVNAKLIESQRICLTVRGAPDVSPLIAGGEHVTPGETVRIEMSVEDFQQWVADATRLTATSPSYAAASEAVQSVELELMDVAPDDFVERLKAENASWLADILIVNPGTSSAHDPLGQRGTIAVKRHDGTGEFLTITDVVDEHILKHALGILAR